MCPTYEYVMMMTQFRLNKKKVANQTETSSSL